MEEIVTVAKRFCLLETTALIDVVGPMAEAFQSGNIDWDEVGVQLRRNSGDEVWPVRSANSYHDKWDKLKQAYRLVVAYHRKESGKQSFWDLTEKDQAAVFAGKNYAPPTQDRYNQIHGYLKADPGTCWNSAGAGSPFAVSQGHEAQHITLHLCHRAGEFNMFGAKNICRTLIIQLAQCLCI